MFSRTTQVIEYPAISPVPEGVHRPFWSVMIPTYNCADYLVQTLESVLAQDPGPEHMQIEVVDDCSTQDDPEAVVREIGKGRVSFYRRPQNGGATSNFNTCIHRSTGHYIHILHGDDFVLENFYSSFYNIIKDCSDVALMVCPSTIVDQDGTFMGTQPPLVSQDGEAVNFTTMQSIRNRVKTPGVIVARWVYEMRGGFNPSLVHCADWEMWFRASISGKTVALAESKTCYRVHSNNDSSKLVISGKNVEEAGKTVDILFEMLPCDLRTKLMPAKYSWISELATLTSNKFYLLRRWDVSLIHASLALRYSPSLFTLRNYLKVFLRKHISKLINI